MTIDITDLINNSGDKFPEKLEAFKKEHPHLFKQEEKPSEANKEGTEADAAQGS